MTVKVQLADRGKEFDWSSKERPADKSYFHFEMPDLPNVQDFDLPSVAVVYAHSSMRSGLMVENLTPQLGEFFGAKDGNGALVRSVEKGSRAEKAGLRAGDVIIRVGDQEIHDSGDFSHALHSRRGGSVRVGVIRDRKEQTITLTLPEQKDSGLVIEESIDMPELDAETQAELGVRDEIAKLRPQLELAKEEARRSAADMERSRVELLRQSDELRERLRHAARRSCLDI
jgi:membrane-associated protease RseP (regulator of RpoE activity)